MKFNCTTQLSKSIKYKQIIIQKKSVGYVIRKKEALANVNLGNLNWFIHLEISSIFPFLKKQYYYFVFQDGSFWLFKINFSQILLHVMSSTTLLPKITK